MSAPNETPEFYQETFTSAAIDGARIAAMTAQILIGMDRTLPEETKERMLSDLAQAQGWLDAVSAAHPQRKTTSVHVVSPSGAESIISPNEGRIILP